jgi:hypothetical protein
MGGTGAGGTGGGGSGGSGAQGGGDAGRDMGGDGSLLFDLPSDTPTPDGSIDQCGGCAQGLKCLECPKGGPQVKRLCTSTCGRDQDCNDSARPKCNIDTTQPGPPSGLCTAADEICLWGSRCASPGTPIGTPAGERPIASLRVGDLVLSRRDGAVVAVPVARVLRLPVSAHHVVRVSLNNGTTLEVSEGHPIADGRTFRDLVPGERVAGLTVTSVQSIPYHHAFTYDILPASHEGTYFAGGLLVGSTLASVPIAEQRAHQGDRSTTNP